MYTDTSQRILKIYNTDNSIDNLMRIPKNIILILEIVLTGAHKKNVDLYKSRIINFNTLTFFSKLVKQSMLLNFLQSTLVRTLDNP